MTDIPRRVPIDERHIGSPVTSQEEPAYTPTEYADLQRRLYEEERARLAMQPDTSAQSVQGGYTVTRRQVIEDQFKVEGPDGVELPLSAFGGIGVPAYGHDQMPYQQLGNAPDYGYADDQPSMSYGHGQLEEYDDSYSMQDVGQLRQLESSTEYPSISQSRIIEIQEEEVRKLANEYQADDQNHSTEQRRGFRMPSKRARLAAAWLITAGLGAFSATHFDQLGNATYHIYYEHFDTDFESVRAAFNGVDLKDKDTEANQESEDIENGEE